MQYWINHNGVQSGPVDLDGLKEMGLTSAAYVWHEGLADWVKITQLPELQGYYEIEQGVPIASPSAAAEQQAAVPATEPAKAVQGQPYHPQQGQSHHQPYQQPSYSQPNQQPQNLEPATAGQEPCPPTNLVWAIIATVLCCLPAGVVAIVYALKVSNKYRAGDIEGAKRASETGAWWCIASIILGIICQPFASMLPMLMASAN